MKPAEGTSEGVQPDFFGGQKRVVIEGKGQVRQASLEDYGKLEKMKAESEYKLGDKIVFKGSNATITTKPYELYGGKWQDAKTVDGKTITVPTPSEKGKNVLLKQKEFESQQDQFRKLKMVGAKTKAESPNARISEIESLLASKKRISTKEHGANREVLRMELGELRAKQFASKNRTPESIEKEIQEAESELQKRSSAITRTMQSRAKRKSGSKLTTLAYQNAYPKLETTSLEYYREELQDQHDMMTGKREMSSDMFEKAIRVMNARTERAQMSDMSRSAKIAPSFQVWANSPNRYDWPNVDTKITRKPKTKAIKSSNPKLPKLKSVG